MFGMYTPKQSIMTTRCARKVTRSEKIIIATELTTALYANNVPD